MKKPLLFLTFLLLSAFASAESLQLHFMDVGQADGILIVSPGGETVLIDGACPGECDRAIAYMDQLGLSKVDYAINSHYHDDHYGCAQEIFTRFPIQKAAYDRGPIDEDGKKYKEYVSAVGTRRKTAEVGTTLTLDASRKYPVILKYVALNGNNQPKAKDENDMSIACLLSYGNFQTILAGDLSGYNKSQYRDIETSVAPLVNQVEVYKVDHHGSKHSTNETWIRTLKPKVAVLSVGIKNTGNRHKHPNREALDRMRSMGVVSYWTERGEGAPAEPGADIVGGNIVVNVEPKADTFTVTYNNGARKDTYDMWEKNDPSSSVATAEGQDTYMWSKNSKIYHLKTCKFVDAISKQNLRTGSAPPSGKTPHECCPKQ